ncbi:hypothetical protein BMS3Bbin07_01349 [bacterium BMS3Bbin07]|nr:hypothetical protein BMS3Bbin07_01349 [bacterium BMS3Bbin07]
MIELIGKNVVVEANGITYTGKLVEISETEVHLETELGWVTLLTEHVVNIREAEDDDTILD